MLIIEHSGECLFGAPFALMSPPLESTYRDIEVVESIDLILMILDPFYVLRLGIYTMWLVPLLEHLNRRIVFLLKGLHRSSSSITFRSGVKEGEPKGLQVSDWESSQATILHLHNAS